MIITYSTHSKYLQTLLTQIYDMRESNDYRICKKIGARKFCIFPCKFAECEIFTLEKKKMD